MSAQSDACRRLLAGAEAHFASMAEDLARRQSERSLAEIDAATRQTVEAVAFLRLGQERGLLESGTLERLAGLPSVRPGWDRLLHSLVERFGPGLCNPQTELPATGEPLRRCIEGLAKRDGEEPLPVEILGRIHQRLLGLRLHRAGNGGAAVRPSLTARKAHGVFYTPEPVAQYIVERTVGPIVDPLSQAVILDPACGCGSFLLAACRRLLQADDLRGRAQPGWVARSLFGVDLDPQAVLAARRVLWLELATRNAPARALLADLVANVRCGDALTGPGLAPLTGRVDAVIGNPPYRRELDAKGLLDRIAATEFGRRWRTARMDLSYYFVHRGLELLRPGGRLSFIMAAYWTAGRGAERLIGALRETTHVEEIVDLGHAPIFPGIHGRHLILRVRKGAAHGTTIIRRAGAANECDLIAALGGEAPATEYRKTAAQLFRAGRVDLEPPAEAFLTALDRWPPLDRWGKVRQGIAENPATVTRKLNTRHGGRWRLGQGVFTLTSDELEQLDLPHRERALIRPYHDLCDLGRYVLAEAPSLWLIYTTRQTCPDIDAFPALRSHLERFRPAMEARRETRAGTRAWWQLHWPRDAALWPSPKVVALQMARRPSFAPAPAPVYVSFSVNVFVPDASVREHLNYFVAVLNSRLLWGWFRHHAKRRGVGLEINGGVLSRAPIRPIDFGDEADRRRHDRLVELVSRAMQVAAAPGRSDGQFDRVDREIDRLVCELYGLTPAEFDRFDEPGA